VIKGRLHFDSARTESSLGQRGTATQPRTLLYQAEEYCIDVMMQEGGARLCIMHGQVLGAGGEPVTDTAIGVGSESVHTDDLGQFALTLLDGTRPPEFTIYASAATIVCEIPTEE
jgi:hypothetical protein